MRPPAKNNNNLLAAELKNENDAGSEDYSVNFFTVSF